MPRALIRFLMVAWSRIFGRGMERANKITDAPSTTTEVGNIEDVEPNRRNL